ncbi:hypothetical protein THAOC_09624 [Thalassiosira oceanica]|uniref:Uncharacterized protein n=1 Tax=Thalassiosira oceanica TaxID=159749 RepID=K0SUR4_THAOC|nr:hypothetical protein THAOC_09624 [Thalassiosira oceanica]|eukprot:EJK69150.1 hypothetical protein THAOC_09624 [Thalassiosira oceanica]
MPSSLAPRIPSPRGLGPLDHHQPPCIVVYARPRRTAARLSAPTSSRSAGEFAVILHRAPLTPVLKTEPFQPEARLPDPNQVKIPPSPGIRRSPRPVRRPSADPVLAQPTIFASSDVAVFLSARRDEASANDTPGSQFAQLVTPIITVTCLRLMTILVLKKWVGLFSSMSTLHVNTALGTRGFLGLPPRNATLCSTASYLHRTADEGLWGVPGDVGPVEYHRLTHVFFSTTAAQPPLNRVSFRTPVPTRPPPNLLPTPASLAAARRHAAPRAHRTGAATPSFFRVQNTATMMIEPQPSIGQHWGTPDKIMISRRLPPTSPVSVAALRVEAATTDGHGHVFEGEVQQDLPTAALSDNAGLPIFLPREVREISNDDEDYNDEHELRNRTNNLIERYNRMMSNLCHSTLSTNTDDVARSRGHGRNRGRKIRRKPRRADEASPWTSQASNVNEQDSSSGARRRR